LLPTSQGREFARRGFVFSGGCKSSTGEFGHFRAANCHGCTLHERRQLFAVLAASFVHGDHYAQPGHAKRSLLLSAEALSRSSEQIGRMVEL
jgi:hypothetical protein